MTPDLSTPASSAGALPDEGADAAEPVEFGQLLLSFRERFEGELVRWLRRRREESTSEAPDAIELTGKLDQYVVRGGKRLRPAVLYYAFRGCGGRHEQSVLPASMAVELLHTYLLIHDDIMDRAATRRGEPAAHRVFADEHRERGWSGDSAHHGLSVAILLGDLAHTYAEELFAACAVTEEIRRGARDCFSLMCREVIVGQYLELTAGQRRQLGEEDLLRVLRMKSGRYSVERPIEIGALLAGAEPPTREGLCRFGALTGEAFQLQDDLLGMFGDRAEVGKPVGGDLVEGKYTLLIFHSLARASKDERRHLLATLGNEAAEPSDIERATAIIRSTGAERCVGEMIDERLAAARRVLAELELEPEGRNFLTGLLEYLRERKR